MYPPPPEVQQLLSIAQDILVEKTQNATVARKEVSVLQELLDTQSKAQQQDRELAKMEVERDDQLVRLANRTWAIAAEEQLKEMRKARTALARAQLMRDTQRAWANYNYAWAKYNKTLQGDTQDDLLSSLIPEQEDPEVFGPGVRGRGRTGGNSSAVTGGAPEVGSQIPAAEPPEQAQHIIESSSSTSTTQLVPVNEKPTEQQLPVPVAYPTPASPIQPVPADVKPAEKQLADIAADPTPVSTTELMPADEKLGDGQLPTSTAALNSSTVTSTPASAMLVSTEADPALPQSLTTTSLPAELYKASALHTANPAAEADPQLAINLQAADLEPSSAGNSTMSNASTASGLGSAVAVDASAPENGTQTASSISPTNGEEASIQNYTEAAVLREGSVTSGNANSSTILQRASGDAPGTVVDPGKVMHVAYDVDAAVNMAELSTALPAIDSDRFLYLVGACATTVFVAIAICVVAPCHDHSRSKGRGHDQGRQDTFADDRKYGDIEWSARTATNAAQNATEDKYYYDYSANPMYTKMMGNMMMESDDGRDVSQIETMGMHPHGKAGSLVKSVSEAERRRSAINSMVYDAQPRSIYGSKFQ
ncbi:hypothetical protein CYMTET_25958 [Cymbomonas tetramitiformis]|uniref:Uncharacterized protein n=1 Tax=Cymbomonas tetramitiformis TaxID=36881 RepID=A0AAE0KYI9_9CHLO|nr:hypothetical protein CYMTET_25958 [Cymbomonas tetramitiformis]